MSINRVLWVDDITSNDSNSRLFIKDETTIVKTMDEALKVFSDNSLYRYDTVVLDINFENGITNQEDVIQDLTNSLFLSDEQKENDYIIKYGGYLLFLYLLVKGYPSDNVAFLTGNPGMLRELKAYMDRHVKKLTNIEIKQRFLDFWIQNRNTNEKFNEKHKRFLMMAKNLPIGHEYMDVDFLCRCEDAILDEREDVLEELIQSIESTHKEQKLQDVGDIMIDKFHEANLESPRFFSKLEDSIPGHNRVDADKWMKRRRTEDNVTRWLLLYLCDYLENLFVNHPNEMESGINDLFENREGDLKDNISTDIRNAFQQMNYVFAGLNKYHRGAYYQAVSAMLIPFDKNVDKEGWKAPRLNTVEDEKVRRMFGWCAKQARNAAAHNRFGSSLQNKSTLFLLMVIANAVLTRDKRDALNSWYEKVAELFHRTEITTLDTVLEKIDEIECAQEQNGDIDSKIINTSYGIRNECSRDYLYRLAANTKMYTAENREEYFLFCFSAYIIKWFRRYNIRNIEKNYGKGVCITFQVAYAIVEEFRSPYLL